jgi:hypothetical protein
VLDVSLAAGKMEYERITSYGMIFAQLNITFLGDFDLLLFFNSFI